jgi:hypothetical protein
MAYNPYNDAQQIVDKKTLYNKSLASKAGDQDLYSQSAQVYYKKLRDNGFGSLADELQGADEETALSILARYGSSTNPNRTPAVASEKMLPEAQAAAGAPFSIINDGSGPTYNSNLKSGLSILDQYIKPSPGQQMSNGQAQSNLQAAFDMFSKGNEDTKTRGNNLWGQMSKYGVDQSKRYDDLSGYIKNTSAVDTAEGKSIMNYYNGLGGQAAKGATANAAGANAGNIDSYSTANANRQQLSYLNSGTQAALNQKNSNVGNILSTIQSLGVDIGDLQNRQVGMYQGDQTYNTNILGKYNEGQNNVAGQLQNQQNAGNGLISDYMNNMLGVNTNDAALKQTDITTKSAEVIKNLDVLLEKYKADSTAESALAVQNAANEGLKAIEELKNQGIITQGEYDIAKAQIDAAAKVTVSENDKAGTLGAAGINAQGGITEATIKADSEADVAYWKSLAERDNGKKDASNPVWGDLLEQVKAVSSGKSSLTGNKPVSYDEAIAIMLYDENYSPHKALLTAIVAALKDADKKTPSAENYESGLLGFDRPGGYIK